MEIRNLKTFVQVAKMLSFRLAAKELNYAQSTVSAQIQSLEDELKVKLFDRLGRSIILTQAGERLWEYGRKLLDLEEEAKNNIKDSNNLSGSLIIRAPETVCVHYLPDVVAEFHAKHPKVRLEFIACAVKSLKKDLRNGFVDLAFLLTSTIVSRDFKIQALKVEPLELVVGVNHALAKQDTITTAQLAGETVLLTKVDCAYRHLLENSLNKLKTRTGNIMEISGVQALIKYLEAGVGIGFLPKVAVEKKIQEKKLKTLNWKEEDYLEAALLMLWHQDKWISPTLQSFMECCRKHLSAM